MSGSLLAVDVGNTRAKWGLFSGRRLLVTGVLPGDDGRETEPDPVTRAAWPTAAPETIALAVTGSAEIGDVVRRALRHRHPGATFVEVATEEAFGGLVNSYGDPATMGVDRWLAMLGAWSRARGALCIVDVGTAVTVDVVAADGRHQGGWIAPGEALMRQALAVGTARVGAHGPALVHERWGSSTGACVALGCAAAEQGAAAAGVRAFLAEYREGYVFLSGGGAARVVDAIGQVAPSVTIDPALVLRGLAFRAGEDGADRNGSTV